MRTFIEAGCDVNLSDSDNWTPLHIAVELGNITAIRMLINAGSDVNSITKQDRQTALHIACEAAVSNDSVVKTLITAGADEF